MIKKRCFSCGSSKGIVRVRDAIARTTGYDVPIENGYACKSCLRDKKIEIKKRIKKSLPGIESGF